MKGNAEESRISMRRVPSLRRRGAAAVELGICLPLFVLVILGSIETCNLIYTQESLFVASYEAARMAVKPGAKESKVKQNGRTILECRGIEDAEIEISPSELQEIPQGDLVTVTVRVPAGSGSWLPGGLFGDREISSQVTFVKE
jgi:Flp pilus assembly protein TadG